MPISTHPGFTVWLGLVDRHVPFYNNRELVDALMGTVYLGVAPEDNVVSKLACSIMESVLNFSPSELYDAYRVLRSMSHGINPVIFRSLHRQMDIFCKLEDAPVEELTAIFNILGEKVGTLLNANVKAGNYELTFDASGIASGMYLYKMESGDFVSVRKMMILK